MKQLGNIGCLLGVSLFVGIILCAIAAGAVFPVLNKFAAGPLVCSHGNFVIHQDTYSYRPGEQDTQTTDYCVDPQTGAKQDVSGITIAVSGLIWSGAIFVVALAVMGLRDITMHLRAAG